MGPNLPVPWWPLRKRYICAKVRVSRPMYHWENFNEWIYHIGILVKSLFVPIVCRINPFQVQVQVQKYISQFCCGLLTVLLDPSDMIAPVPMMMITTVQSMRINSNTPQQNMNCVGNIWHHYAIGFLVFDVLQGGMLYPVNTRDRMNSLRNYYIRSRIIMRIFCCS